MPRRHHLIRAVQIILAAALLFYIYRSGLLRPAPMVGLLRHPGLAAAALALVSAGLVLAGLRWGRLARAQGIRTSPASAVAVYYSAMFISQFLFGSVSGDAYRVYYLLRAAPDNRMGGLVSVVMDRVLGIGALLTVGLGVSLFYWEQVSSRPVLMALEIIFGSLLAGILLVLALGFIFAQPLQRRCQGAGWAEAGFLKRALWRLFQTTGLYRKRLGVVGTGALLSILVHLTTLGAVVLVAASMSVGNLGRLEYGFAALWAQVINNIPLTPGGLGVGEGAFAKLCQFMDPAAAAGIAYASIFLAFRAIGALAALPGAAIHFMRRGAVSVSNGSRSDQRGKRFTE